MSSFRFPLVKNTPTDSEYKEICPDGGSRPPCQLKVTAHTGAASSSGSYGKLTVVNLPLESTGNGCETLVEIWLQTGCPPDTIDMTWDADYSDDAIDRSNSANIGVADGYGPFEWEIVGGHGFTLKHAATGGRTNILYADSVSCGAAQIQVIDACQNETIGTVTCEQLPLLGYDWDSSAQTCTVSDMVTIAIVGGTAPYSWSVSGTGFTLHSGQGYGLTNFLYSDASACGSAHIVVRDLCGTTVEGSVRCTTNGHWVFVDNTCGSLAGAGVGTVYPPGPLTVCNKFETIRGAYKAEESFVMTKRNVAVYCGGTPNQCDSYCNTHVPVDGCYSCLLGRIPTCPEIRYNCSGTPTGTDFCCFCTGSTACCIGVSSRGCYEWIC